MSPTPIAAMMRATPVLHPRLLIQQHRPQKLPHRRHLPRLRRVAVWTTGPASQRLPRPARTLVPLTLSRREMVRSRERILASITLVETLVVPSPR